MGASFPLNSKYNEDHLMRDHSRMPPKFLVFLGTLLLRFMNWLQDTLMPPPMRVVDLAFTGFTQCEVIRTVCALGVADVLAGGPMTAKELSLVIGAHSERLFRLLRFAATHGIFAMRPAEAGNAQQNENTMLFSNNKLSAVLREDHPNCQKFAVLALMGKQHLAGGWSEMEWGVRTGGLLFEKFYGEPFFKQLTFVEGLEDVYSKAMSNLDHTCANSILEDYNWAAYNRYIDIGGAYGSFLADLLTQHPSTTGVLFDQAQVIERADMLWSTKPAYKELKDRMSFVSGNFFVAKTLPRGSRRDGKGDVYIMRQICHDWPDNATVEILTNLRTAMGDAPCTLALVEAAILPSKSPTGDYKNRARTASDLHMMVQHDGKERDTEQWRAILAAAGFELRRVVATRSIFSIVEAVPAARPGQPGQTGQPAVKKLAAIHPLTDEE